MHSKVSKTVLIWPLYNKTNKNYNVSPYSWRNNFVYAKNTQMYWQTTHKTNTSLIFVLFIAQNYSKNLKRTED